MKHIFIINPNSGRNKKFDMENKIRSLCQKKEMDFHIYRTSAQGEAERIVKMLKDEEPAVIYAVGGDGTVNEVVNGMIGSNHMLSVIPSGSGNDFYRTLKLYKKEYIRSDIGKINDRYFINIACIGIDAEIANNVSLMRKFPVIPVSQRYNASIIYTFLKYKFKKLKFRFGELSKEGSFTIVTVCNARYYGSGFQIAPHAMIDDGQLEIYTVEKMPKINIPGLLLKLKKGRHEEDKRVYRYTDSSVDILCDDNVICNVDGEQLESDRFHIEVVKNGITIFKNTEFLQELGIEK